jgi:pimeloyl-ACP methyl ester carboxylesterase
MVKARPDLFYAFIGTGQVAAEFSRSSAVAYTTLLERASRQGNLQAVQELKGVGPPPYKDGKGFGVLHKWAMLFERADVFLASALGFALTAPGYSVGDINDWFEGQRVSGEHLEPFFDELDRKLLRGELAVPVFVIQGAEDYTTPVSLAKNYLDSLRALHKGFATIESAGHFAVFTKQDEFLKDLRSQVLPFTH